MQNALLNVFFCIAVGNTLFILLLLFAQAYYMYIVKFIVYTLNIPLSFLWSMMVSFVKSSYNFGKHSTCCSCNRLNWDALDAWSNAPQLSLLQLSCTLLPSSLLAYPTDITILLLTSYLPIKTLVSRLPMKIFEAECALLQQSNTSIRQN